MAEFEFKIRPDYDHTLGEISRSPVHDRTSHAGNLSKTSQAVIKAGNATILMFSGNQGTDPTYKPTTISAETETIRISKADEPQDKLTAFIPIDTTVLNYVAVRFGTSELRGAKSLAQLHIASAQEMWGEQRVQPYHSIFLTPEGVEILSKLAQIPGACDRMLNVDGTLGHRGFSTVAAEELINTTKSIAYSSIPGHEVRIVPGPVLSNPANTVAHGFIRALPHIRDGGLTEVDIFHSSGPDMINYTQKEKFQNEARRVATELARKLQLGGVSITEQIYPASDLRISAPDSPQARYVFHQFSAFVDMLFALQLQGDEKNEEIKKVSIHYGLQIENEERLTTAAKGVVNKLAESLGDQIPSVPGLNFKPRQYTQWTMLGNGRKPPIVPEIFSRLNARQIIYFTKVAESLISAKRKIAVAKKLPEDIKPK